MARLQTDALLQQNALQVQGILEILTLALNLPPVSDAEAERQWQLVSPRPPSFTALETTCKSRVQKGMMRWQLQGAAVLDCTCCFPLLGSNV